MTFIAQFYQTKKSDQGKPRQKISIPDLEITFCDLKFQFIIQIIKLRYPANVTQRIYGKRSHAAAFETR